MTESIIVRHARRNVRNARTRREYRAASLWLSYLTREPCTLPIAEPSAPRKLRRKPRDNGALGQASSPLALAWALEHGLTSDAGERGRYAFDPHGHRVELCKARPTTTPKELDDAHDAHIDWLADHATRADRN